MFLIKRLTRLPYTFPRGVRKNNSCSVLRGHPSSQARGSVGCRPHSPAICREGHSGPPVCSGALAGGGQPGILALSLVQVRPGHCVAFCLQRKWPASGQPHPASGSSLCGCFSSPGRGAGGRHLTPRAETMGQRSDATPGRRQIKRAIPAENASRPPMTSVTSAVGLRETVLVTLRWEPLCGLHVAFNQKRMSSFTQRLLDACGNRSVLFPCDPCARVKRPRGNLRASPAPAGRCFHGKHRARQRGGHGLPGARGPRSPGPAQLSTGTGKRRVFLR